MKLGKAPLGDKMSSSELECIERPDIYGIVSSIYYLLFGLLGLLTNNSFLNDIHTYLFLTGIGAILEFSGQTEDFMQIPLVICTGSVAYKLLSEFVKKWSGENFDESERVMGIQGEKFYRLPVSLLSVIVGAYVCLTILYYNVYLTISLLFITQILSLVITRKFFPRGTEHYTNTRKMIVKLMVSAILGCIGLGTSDICPGEDWLWIRLFIGYPIANVCLAYSLFTSAQLILLLRGKNLSRRTALRGNNFIFIAYYVGRFGPSKTN